MLEMSGSLKRNLRLVEAHGKGSRQRATAGFTLLEILAIVAILGILASIAIAIYQDYKTNVQITRITKNRQNVGKLRHRF